MGSCSKCGNNTGSALVSRYSVTSAVKQIDGQTAGVQFRRRTNFDYNGVPMRFAPSQVAKLNYVHIYAALLLDNSCLHFLNPAEKTDFITNYPDMVGAQI